jgi:lysozyme
VRKIVGLLVAVLIFVSMFSVLSVHAYIIYSLGSETVVTVEDTDPGFTKYGTPSYWYEDYVSGDHMYWTYNGYNTIDNWAKWTPSLPTSGTYAVYVWIPANHATTTNAIYTIHHSSVDDTRYVNQGQHSCWILLGYFYFSASGDEYVKLVDMTYESYASKQVGFDAVRWVKREFNLPQYVNGIDVSHWQGSINWQQVYNAGFKFAFAKATEGTTIVDANFIENMNNGKNAGMLMGAYHFARPGSSATDAADEANYFVDHAGPYITTGYLRPALDLEVTGGLSRAALSQWVNNFMSIVKSRTGVEPILYTSPSFANDYLDNTVKNKYNLWIAHWRTDLNPNTDGWYNWDFWQHSIGAKGSVPGINAEVDWDRFNGDWSRLQTFVLKPEMDERIDNAIAWALDWADGPPYPPGGPHADEMYIGWCLAFVQDAYQYGAGAKIQRYEYAKQAADALGAENNKGIPPRGAFVFYNWYGTIDGEYRNWGHVGLSLGNGQMVHAWTIGPEVASYDTIGLEYIGWAWPPLTPPIVPEFPSWLIPAALILLAVPVYFCAKSRRKPKTSTSFSPIRKS